MAQAIKSVKDIDIQDWASRTKKVFMQKFEVASSIEFRPSPSSKATFHWAMAKTNNCDQADASRAVWSEGGSWENDGRDFDQDTQEKSSLAAVS